MLRPFFRALLPLWLVAASAAAQSLDDVAGQGAGSLELERWRPSIDGNGILDVESGSVGEDGETDAAAHLGYTFAPMTGTVLLDGKSTAFRVVDHRLGGNVTGALGLLPRFKVGFDLPVVLFQAGPASIPGLTGNNPVALFGSGDLRAVAKYGVLRVADGAPLDLALVGHLTLPTAFPRHQYMGDGLPTLATEVALSRGYGALRWAFNTGPKFRAPSTFGPAVQGQELGYRFGLAWDGEGLPLGLDASINGAALLTPSPLSTGNNPAEVLVGVHHFFGDLLVFGSVGTGIPVVDGIPVGGVGAPLLRIQTGVRYMPRCGDDDGDALCRAEDKCPDAAEDNDGFEDSDGCPDADNDNDGIVDPDDKCPDAAEDNDGFEDSDGCADVDNDKDGIVDTADKCATQAEDNDGFEDSDGCADVDNDKDGIADTADKCATQAEDQDGFEDSDGCPELDNDSDGIVDAADKCPLEPEDKDGNADDDGCPEENVPQVAFSLSSGASFNTGSALLRDAAKDALRTFARQLKATGRPVRVRVEGHTDDTGSTAVNDRISQKRADAVRAFLIDLGIPAANIEAKGFGESKPKVPNDTAENRAQNRRVEFYVDG
jgi:outer membrane protein OmpA-like peptidoglycan-associated protein